MKKYRGETWKKVKTINLENLGFLTIKGGKEMGDNVEKWTLEDGRRVEKTTTENQIGEEIERIIEIRVDEERPSNLQQKIIEKIKPVVYERVTEDVDVQTGEIVKEKVESINTKLKEESSFVTREEMIEAIVSAIKTIKNKPIQSEQQSELKSLGLADEIEKKSLAIMPMKDIALLLVIALQVLALIYLIVF